MHVPLVKSDETFIITNLKRKEKLAFESFKKVCDDHRSECYVQVVNDLLSHYHDMGCNMFLKVLVLHSHLDFLAENPGDVSGYFIDGRMTERKMESWLAHYCSGIKREDHTP